MSSVSKRKARRTVHLAALAAANAVVTEPVEEEVTPEPVAKVVEPVSVMLTEDSVPSRPTRVRRTRRIIPAVTED